MGSREILSKNDLDRFESILMIFISFETSFLITFQFIECEFNSFSQSAFLKSVKSAIFNAHLICEKRAFEWYKYHQNRISRTYSKLMKSCLIALVKVNGQGHFLTIFCLWSHLFLTFAWHHQSPVAILIQPRDLRAMVRGWTPGMTPSYDSVLQKKMFRHDIGIRSISRLNSGTSNFCSDFWNCVSDTNQCAFFTPRTIYKMTDTHMIFI